MSTMPKLPPKEIGIHHVAPLMLATMCRERAQALFEVIAPGQTLPPEKVVKDDQREERFDSATMTYYREIIVEWSLGDVLMHMEAKSDGMYSYEDVYTFKFLLRSASAEFQTFCDAMVKTVHYLRDRPDYYLDLQKSQVTSKGLTADQLEQLAKLLNLPPELTKAPASTQ